MIEVKDFSFKFGKDHILDNISFNVNKGEVVGLFGTNGSGKTTLLKSILSLYKVYEGVIQVRCNDFIGIIEEPGFSLSFSGYENLEYFLTKEQLENASYYFEKFDMNSYIHNKVKTYSQGMRQKLALVLVFSSESGLIILDEPLNSLDITARVVFNDIVDELKQQGTSFVISSHILDNSLTVIDRVFLLNKTKLEVIKYQYDTYLVTFDSLQDVEKFKRNYHPDIIHGEDCKLEIKLDTSPSSFLKEYSSYGINTFVKSNLTDRITDLIHRNEVSSES